MSYQIIANNNIILDSEITNVIIVLIVLLLLTIFTLVYIWKRFKENRHLKYEFITIVAHKFRTPMTYIKWVCDAMIPDETDSFKKKSLEDIKRSNQKIIDLTSTLIEIADSDSSGGVTYNIEKILIYDFVKNVSDRFSDTLHEKNLFFSLNCENHTLKIKADVSRLEFVIYTLLENACNYSTPGKNVSIDITSNLFKIKISVLDNGIGISKKDLSHVFTKFYRGKNARITDTEGLGVGLYLASSIIKRLKGRISVRSEGEGMGTKFTITMPRWR
jgi:signal transduction histidine kinase